MKRNKSRGITDEMIGHADRVCTCSETVGNLIASQNKKKKTSLKHIVHSNRKKKQKP
ncbi:MAG: hypothetical protein JSV13_01065 [Nitrospiraceae bacterium]|jgi:hypothetical protein|nr:MAG: hypothetical protein JSV13_01065 [Nitrospiraceae bacterium]